MKLKNLILSLLIFTGLFSPKPILPAEQSLVTKAFEVVKSNKNIAIAGTAAGTLAAGYYLYKKGYWSSDNLKKLKDKILLQSKHIPPIIIGILINALLFKMINQICDGQWDYALNIKINSINDNDIIHITSNNIIDAICYGSFDSRLNGKDYKARVKTFHKFSGIIAKMISIAGTSFLYSVLNEMKQLRLLNEAKEKYNNSLTEAIQSSNLDSLTNLLNNELLSSSDPLEICLRLNKIEEAKRVLNHPAFTLPENYNYIIHYAAEKESDDIIIRLLELGADLNKIFDNEKTILEKCCNSGELKKIKFLMKHGASKLGNGEDITEETLQAVRNQVYELLTQAIEERNMNHIKILVKKGIWPHYKVHLTITEINAAGEVRQRDTVYPLLKYAAIKFKGDPQLNEIYKELLKTNGDPKIVEEGSEDMCSICLGVGEMYATKCKHYFHIDCLKEAIVRDGLARCPLCRAEQ